MLFKYPHLYNEASRTCCELWPSYVEHPGAWTQLVYKKILTIITNVCDTFVLVLPVLEILKED